MTLREDAQIIMDKALAASLPDAAVEKALKNKKPVPSAMPRTRVRMNTAPCAEITVLSRSLANTLTIRKRKNTEVHWEKANKHPTPFPQDIKKGLLNTSCSASLFS